MKRIAAILGARSAPTSNRISVLALLLAMLLVLGACTSDDDETGDEQDTAKGAGVEDETGEAGSVDPVLTLLADQEVPFEVPEIVIFRDWADHPGTFVQLENPLALLELYRFDSRTGLNKFVSRAQLGSVPDLPANAAAWSFESVLVVLPGAAELPTVATLLNSIFPADAFPLASDAASVDRNKDTYRSGSDDLGDATWPPTLVAGTDTIATRAGLGAYCWSGNKVGGCADATEIISGIGALAITGAESVTLTGDLFRIVIQSATAEAWLLHETELIEQGKDFNAWTVLGTALAIPVVVVDKKLVLTPGLPQGDYLVSVRVLTDRGDAQYGILLEVDGGHGFEMVKNGSDSAQQENRGEESNKRGDGEGAEPSEERASPSTEIVLAAFNEPFRLASGGVANVGGQVSLIFVGVQADNRCSPDTTCAVAGAAVVMIELVDGETASQMVVDVPPNREVAFSSLGFDGSVLRVSPESHSEREILAEDYVMTIMLSVPSGGGNGDTAEPEPPYRQQNTLAPIENVRVNIAESSPVQVFVMVSSVLPSECAKFDRIEVERADSSQINLTVWNLVPAPDETVACTAIYGITENTVALGTDFEAGVEQVVVVNGVVGVAFTP